MRTDNLAPSGPLQQAVSRVRNAQLSTTMIVGILIVTLVVNALVQPTFFTAYAFTSTLATLVPLGLIALAQAVVILGGGVDLSIGASVTLASVVAVVVMDGQDSRSFAGVAAALVVGALCGLFNGVIIAILRLQPIIVTFATSSIFGGIALLVLPKPGGSVSPFLASAYRDSVFGIPIAGLLVLATIGIWLILKRTKIIRHIYALGGNKEASFASLVPVQRVQIASYTIGGAIGGLAAIALLANAGSGDPFIGLDMLLDSIAAVVIGGIPLIGGRGSAIGAIFGAVVLAQIENIIFFTGIDTNYRPLVSGLVIVAALSLSALTMRERGRSA